MNIFPLVRPSDPSFVGFPDPVDRRFFCTRLVLSTQFLPQFTVVFFSQKVAYQDVHQSFTRGFGFSLATGEAQAPALPFPCSWKQRVEVVALTL